MSIRRFLFAILILICSNSFAQEVIQFTSGANINDYDSRVFKQTVNLNSENANKLVFSVDINHSWVNDLEITITNPAGNSAIAFSRLGDAYCFGCGGDDLLLSFSEDALISYDSLSSTCGEQPAYEGMAKPMQSLDLLLNDDPNGEWMIEVKDLWPYEDGYINDLALIFTNYLAPECTNITYPIDQQIDVLINDTITWDPVEGSTGYLLNLGDEPGVYNIEFERNLGNVTFYELENLTCGKSYYAQVQPYNDFGIAESCAEISFETKFIVVETIGDVSICKGDTVQLEAWGAVYYKWFPETFLSDPKAKNPLFTGDENMVYTITASDNQGCTDSATVSVTVNTIDIIIDTVKHVRVGQPGFINISMDDPEGEYSYSWHGPNNFYSDSEDIEGLEIGCYELYVVNNMTGCNLDTVICVDDLTSVFHYKTTGSVNAFPVPFNQELTVALHDFKDERLIVDLFAGNGIRLSGYEKQPGDTKITYDTSTLPSGVYMLLIQEEKGRWKKMVRIIKK